MTTTTIRPDDTGDIPAHFEAPTRDLSGPVTLSRLRRSHGELTDPDFTIPQTIAVVDQPRAAARTELEPNYWQRLRHRPRHRRRGALARAIFGSVR